MASLNLFLLKTGAKIDSDYHCKQVLKPFMKELKARYPNNNMTFHQDSASSHVSKETLQFLRKNDINYITPLQWMPNSPDCSPCDYWLLGYLKSRVTKRKVTTIIGLKKAIRQELRTISIRMVHRVLKAWPRRCRLVYYQNRGHIQNFI